MKNKPSINLKEYGAHFQRHLETSGSTCQWNGCGQRLSSHLELRRHLFAFHSITTRQSPFRPQFCLQHPSDGWFTCEFAWEDHCKKHLISPQASCDLDRRYGTVVAGITCPFCLGNEKLPASERVRQFTNRGRFNVHLQNSHYRGLEESIDVCCPHPLCYGKSSHPSLKELKVHFYDCHGLPEKGFAATRGVMLGGRGASKFSSIDTDQEEREEFDLDKEQDQNEEFDFDINQDQEEELDLKWSEDSGFASPADDIWETAKKQTSPEFKDNFGLNPEDSWFRENEIIGLDESYLSSFEIPANSWSLSNDANDISSIFQYIDLPHNTQADGLERFLSTPRP